MDETRAALSTKLETLESQVMENVQTASEGVASAVEGVKATVETVSETVQSVTDTLNISRHLQNNPIAAMGCSVAVGFVAGLMFGGGRNPTPQPQAAAAESPPVLAPPPAVPATPAVSGHNVNLLHTASVGLTGLAVGAMGGVLRRLISSHLPKELHEQLNGFVRNITDGLGFSTEAEPTPAAETRRAKGRKNRLDETGNRFQSRQSPRNGNLAGNADR